MDSVLKDDARVKLYAQIQHSLIKLKSNEDDEINNLISQIPELFLTQKEDLMQICQLFSCYAINSVCKNRSAPIKLFEKIITPIKTYLQNESTFFWMTFAGLNYFKLWMYEEGLINIEQIIQASRYDKSYSIAFYFYPEIYENEPNIFEDEFKYQILIRQNINIDETPNFLKNNINKHKELRKKYFKWLRNSGDVNDQIFELFEPSQLRLSIKRDDIEMFQKIISNLNLSINARIDDSFLENFFNEPISLVELAMQHNSMKIFKFLILNNVNIGNDYERLLSLSMKINNYDMMHIIESKDKQKFEYNFIYLASSCWNLEIIDYLIDVYVVNNSDELIIKTIIENALIENNFIIIDSIVIPFLNENPAFFKANIYQILSWSLYDYTVYLFSRFLKLFDIDINCNTFSEDGFSLLSSAIREQNLKAVEILLKEPNIDIYTANGNNQTQLQYAIAEYSDLKMIKMFCNHPNFDSNIEYIQNEFYSALETRNNYAIEYLMDNFANYVCNDYIYPIILCMFTANFTILKVFLKHYVNENENTTFDMIIQFFVDNSQNIQGFEIFINVLRSCINEINN